jgi:serine/threonine protein kinase
MDQALGVGDALGGKYVVERLLGQGGMGAVYVARQEQLNRRVAIKVLLPTALVNAEAVARFEREARASAALQSDHVTRVLDVGRLENGAPYIVMELLEGEDLGAVLARRGPLPAAEVVRILLQVCDAIAEAHAAGIVHRDLKPANIFQARRPNGNVTIKVLDFGISKAAVGGQSVALTSSVAVMGTPRYMSPEQLRESRNVDGRSDIWALGVTAYELLSGATPFAKDTLAELCAEILTVDPPPLWSVRPDVPEPLASIVARCMRKDPAARFENVAALVASLEAAAAVPSRGASEPTSAGSWQSATVVAPVSRDGLIFTASPVVNTGLQVAPARRRVPASLLAALLAVLVVATALVGVSALRGKPAPAPPAAAHAPASPASAPVATAPVLPLQPPSSAPVDEARPPAPLEATTGTAAPAPRNTAAEPPRSKIPGRAASPGDVQSKPHSSPGAPVANPLDLEIK